MYHSVHPIYNSNWRSPSRIVGNKRSSISCLSIVHVMMISAVCWTNMIALTSAFIQYPRIAASLARATTATSPPVHDPVHEERSLVLGKCTRIGLDQDSTPLVDALAEAASNVRSPLFYPGHKMGRFSHRPQPFDSESRQSVGLALISLERESTFTATCGLSAVHNLCATGQCVCCRPIYSGRRSTRFGICGSSSRGHTGGSGAPERFVDVILGGNLDALRHDLPELPELDNLFAPEGPIRDAELLAADAFGAAKTWLLANGSTCGVIASILACVQWHKFPASPSFLGNAGRSEGSGVGSRPEGQGAVVQRKSVIILPRDAHKSAVHALVLSGATPCFLTPVRHPDIGNSLGIGTLALETALREHGDEAAAVFLVSPTYEGACADLAPAVALCHAAGVPVIVDEAHGAHLAFLDVKGDEHPPKGALQSGADLVVQSAHKTLGSLTQSAFLHLGKGMLSDADGEGASAFSAKQAVYDALALVQSSSPNYLLLASLDAARWSLVGKEKSGQRRLNEAVQVVHAVREEISSTQGVRALEFEGEYDGAVGFVRTDPLRLTVSFDGGLGGFEADEILIEEFGVYAELPAPGSITFAFGPGSTAEHGQVLIKAIRHLARKASNRAVSAEASGSARERIAPPGETAIPPKQMYTPREAYFSPSKIVSAHEAIGMASAETVCPYPPGIPALLPGEVITQESLDILEAVKAGGGVVSGCTDQSLATMRVVDSYYLPA